MVVSDSPKLGATCVLRFVLVALTVGPCLLLAAPPASAQKSDWVLPIGPPAEVLASFDPPAQPWLAGHRGVDLSANPGTVVRAAGTGTVRYAAALAGRGVVTVVHGDLRTTYEPIEAAVQVGDAVASGQFLGVVGAGGHCGNHCLHWGLLRAETYLDPMLLLDHEPPVLKSIKPTGPRAIAGTNSAGGSNPTRNRTNTRVPDAGSSGGSREVAQPSQTDDPSHPNNQAQPESEPSAPYSVVVGASLLTTTALVTANVRRRRNDIFSRR